ncbi:MAG: ABC transporter ATP-binding protein [Eubacteriales bacterium]|nr:ABC transporter ATP-binding protein [Eubacteriales bacterium]
MDAIRLEHVTKSFGENVVLDDFSLSVGQGEFLTVIGRSGCGKTTMLKMINGLFQPDRGAVFVEDKDIRDVDIIALRRRIGYVIQNKGLFPHMTVEKNITYVPVISGRKNKAENHQLALKLLDTVGLEEGMAGRYPAELSGGQQQRVGIARALAASPRILLMDEPFGALDEITRQTMQDEILRLQKELELTIVFITHDIREAMKLGTRVLVMDEGKVVQLDKPEIIRNQPATSFVRKLVQG